MTGATITCHQLVELVTDYLEGAMPPGERERLEAHLSRCRPCKRYLQQMRMTIKTVGRLPEESISEEARRDLIDVFRAWKQG
jgi:anti-sigma factor RsiW